MDIRFQAGGASSWKTDWAVTFAFAGEGPDKACPELAEASPWLGLAPAWQDFKGKSGESMLLYGPPAMEIPRVLVVGLGEKGKLRATAFRHALGNAARLCHDKGAKNLGLDMISLARVAVALKSEKFSAAEIGREAVLSVLLGLYRYDRWLTDKKEQKPDPRWLALLLAEKHVPDAVRDAARLGEAEAQGLMLARDMANGPANLVTPSFFAETVQEVAARHSMACRVLGPADMEKEGMGALLGVARGARQEPRMAVVEYTPKGAEGKKPVVLVGKGITFDSGGLSLKPAAGMAEMKGDMSGAAAVLGVMDTLGRLATQRAPSRPVVAVLPCTENMPGGNALHPGDIVTTMAGKTVEILNTDAEGRLILADAMAYAQKYWQPELLIDIATLTGACVMALGKDAAGLFCDDDRLAARLLALGERLGERSWRLPLWEDTSKEGLKSAVADLANVGPREGGAIHAAVFLKQFVKPGIPWAHLDIAATDCTESPINAKGASGFGVRTLLEMVW